MAKITVIDDSQASIAMLVPVLEKAGHTVASYNESADIESKLESDLPNLVISDIVMPNRNGYDVLRSLKRHEKLKNIPVILMSTKDQETDVRWGLRLGAVDYVTKPFEEQDMLKAVNKALSSS